MSAVTGNADEHMHEIIPLKNLPNRKTCYAPGCQGCEPELVMFGFNDPMGGEKIEVQIPRCRTTGRDLATLEEANYAELLGCRRHLAKDGVITGKIANIVRRCLGYSVDELDHAFLGHEYSFLERPENQDRPIGPVWHMILLGIVAKQIYKFES